jgi:phospholipid/cholesterol/gamma-HCH transport system substrate-binding protein
MSYTRLIGIGVFVLGGLALFTFGLFMIGSRRMLFESRFEVYAEFSKIAALQRGGKVRVAGMDAGEVDSIMVPPTPTGHFRVKLFVRGDLHQLVRTDSVATIQTDGIVGNKFVEIDAGSDTAPQAPDGSTIVGRDPFEFADLMAQASGGINTLITTINDLKGDVQQMFVTVTKTASITNDLLRNSSDDVKAMTASARAITHNLQSITDNINHGRGSLGKLMNDDELYHRVAAIAKQTEEITTQLKGVVTSAREAVDKFNGKGGGMQTMQSDLQQTMTYARESMANLAENTEALKRNFLFRGMFKERGFYDLDSVSIEEYRAGTFAGEDREPLRIWLSSPVLFAAEPNGQDILTEEGRRRIDIAMATFLRYPPGTPLVIEGYSTLPTSDLQLLRSRERGALVRNYVIGRFSLAPNAVGAVPLGADAPDSPSGDHHWDGIGLALWVRRDAFAPAPGVEKAAEKNGARKAKAPAKAAAPVAHSSP